MFIKTTQNFQWNYTTTNVWIAEKNEEMRNSTSKEIRRINCTSIRKRKRYLCSSNNNLDELLKNELNHEEPPWRTLVTKGWWDRMKDERIRWALRRFRWRFRRNGHGNLNSGKKRWKHLELEFIPQEQTLKEGITWQRWSKNKNYVMLILIQFN